MKKSTNVLSKIVPAGTTTNFVKLQFQYFLGYFWVTASDYVKVQNYCKEVLKNFAKLKRKQPKRIRFFSLIKQDSIADSFSWEVCNFFENNFSINTFERLLLRAPWLLDLEPYCFVHKIKFTKHGTIEKINIQI